MAGKSMEQRVKDYPLQARWRSAQAKNKALGDRKFSDLGKLLEIYDYTIDEHEDEGAGMEDATTKIFGRINVVMTAFMNRNQQLHKSLSQLEADFSKSLDGMVQKRTDRANQYSILLAQFTDKRQVVLSDFIANDRTTSDKVLDIVADLAEAAQSTKKQEEALASKCDRLAAQLRSMLQDFKRQIDAKDKNSTAALDDLLKLL